MEPEIRTIPSKLLIGISITTYHAENKTIDLWKQFMSRKNEIKNIPDDKLYSVQIFDPAVSMKNFTPQTRFQKWAAVEVTEIESIPDGMASLVLSGKYAVFIHKGLWRDFPKTSQYIFGTWLPNSPYEADTREHFEVMDKKYLGPENPASEEEIWVPIRGKLADS